MKNTLFRETKILLGYVKTLLVYACVVIVDKFYCRRQHFNMTSDKAGWKRPATGQAGQN